LCDNYVAFQVHEVTGKKVPKFKHVCFGDFVLVLDKLSTFRDNCSFFNFVSLHKDLSRAMAILIIFNVMKFGIKTIF
jgi:hypothetical protein